MPDTRLGPYGNPAQAILALQQALLEDPGSRTLQAGLAALYLKQGHFEEAYLLLKALVGSRPLGDDLGLQFAWACLGSARIEELFSRLLGHAKEGPWSLELGVEAGSLGRWDVATRLFQRALAVLPGDPDAIHRLSISLDQEGRFQESTWMLVRALEGFEGTAVQGARLRFHLGENLLRQGYLDPGLRFLEARFDLGKGPRLAPMPLPFWQGEPLEGRHLLIRLEQGFGDNFMFIRYASLLAERGAAVLLEPLDRAADVLSTCPGITRTIHGEVLVPTDTLQAPMMSLPLLCGTSLASIPARIPYLRVPESVPSRQAIETCLASAPHPRRIGLVWAGNPDHPRDCERSAPAALLDRLGSVPDTTWVSLQLGAVSRPDLPMVDLAPHLRDYSDTAYALQRLDGLISVDTSLVHLAGALGKPVWLAITRVPDWRWMLDRTDSPWYPTVELWRQPAPGDWTSVFEAMATRLKTSGFP